MLDFLREYWRGVTAAVVLHGVLLVVLVFGLPTIDRAPRTVTPAPIRATVVNSQQLEQERRRRQEAQQAEQRRQREAVEAEARRKREAEEAEQARLAEIERQRQEAERRVQVEAEQRARQEQLTRERQQAEERRRAEEARKERERQELEAQRKAEEEARRKAEEEARRKAEEEARRRAAEAQRQAELEARMRAEIEAEEEYLNVQGSPAFQQWVAVVENHVSRNWLKPISARPDLSCTVRVGMIPGWEVVSVQITQCNGDEAVRRSIEAAVQKSSPLPRPPPGVPFERVIEFVFEPEE